MTTDKFTYVDATGRSYVDGIEVEPQIYQRFEELTTRYGYALSRAEFITERRNKLSEQLKDTQATVQWLLRELDNNTAGELPPRPEYIQKIVNELTNTEDRTQDEPTRRSLRQVLRFTHRWKR